MGEVVRRTAVHTARKVLCAHAAIVVRRRVVVHLPAIHAADKVAVSHAAGGRIRPIVLAGGVLAADHMVNAHPMHCG